MPSTYFVILVSWFLLNILHSDCRLQKEVKLIVFLFSYFLLIFTTIVHNKWRKSQETNTPQHHLISGMKYIPERSSVESPELCAFLKTPETFWTYFGCHKFLHILNMKFCNKFALSYLEIIVKDNLFRIWLFRSENFLAFPEKGPQFADQF